MELKEIGMIYWEYCIAAEVRENLKNGSCQCRLPEIYR